MTWWWYEDVHELDRFDDVSKDLKWGFDKFEFKGFWTPRTWQIWWWFKGFDDLQGFDRLYPTSYLSVHLSAICYGW